MRHTILFFLLIFFLTSYSQNLKIEYDFTVNKSNDLATTTKKYVLEQNSSYSNFYFDKVKDKSQFKNSALAEVIFDRDSVVAYIIGDDVVEFFFKENHFKDFANDLQYYNFSIGYKSNTTFIKEKISLFDWKISENEKDTIIGGYNCKKAVTQFRGRGYVAYFTNEIANQGGPWKFDGLPGFILQINSIDGYLSISPTKIVSNILNATEILNPYAEKRTISFQEIKDVILESDKKYVKKMKSMPNPPDKITINAPDAIENLGLGERIYQ